jgi:hypothetical protein
MSREQKVAVFEAYLNCFATKDLSKVSFAEDVTFEGPRMPKLTGRPAIHGFLGVGGMWGSSGIWSCHEGCSISC